LVSETKRVVHGTLLRVTKLTFITDTCHLKQNPLIKAFQDFSVVISGLRIVSPESQTPDMLHDLLSRIDAAQQLLSNVADSDTKNRDSYKFYNIWSLMARAEVFYRLNDMHEHEVALKETTRRYFALPRNMFRKALHGLSSVRHSHLVLTFLILILTALN